MVTFIPANPSAMIKKCFALLVVATLATATHAQLIPKKPEDYKMKKTKDKAKDAKDKAFAWGMGLLGSPDFYQLKSATESLASFDFRSAFRSGLDVALMFDNRSELYLQPSFSSLGYNIDYNLITTIPNDPNIPDFSKITARYLDLPFRYSFNFVAKDRLKVYMAAGGSASLLISQKDETTFADGSKGVTDYLNNAVFSAQVGAGVSFRITKRKKLAFDLNFRQYLQGFDNFMMEGTYPTSFNTALGIVHTFKNKKKD
jgi:hypothetical protein